jgi:hypothetical protein
MGLYLTRQQGTGTKIDPFRAKYFPDIVPAVNWIAMPFGTAPVFLVGSNLSVAQETTLDANSDFTIVPPLDNILTSGQVTTIQTRLENNGIPAGWVTTSFTSRQVLRIVMAMFQLCQRANISIVTANLDLRLNQIPVEMRTALQDAATSFGWSLTGITGSTTVRTALKLLADQWGSAPFHLGEDYTI